PRSQDPSSAFDTASCFCYRPTGALTTHQEDPMRGRIQVFGGNGNPELVQEICDYIGLRPGRVELHRFSNENLFVQIQENVRESDVFVVQPFVSPVHENLVELMIMMD